MSDEKTESQNKILTITKSAIDKIKEIREKENMSDKSVRIEILPTGHGIAYNMEFSNEKRDGDTIQEDGGMEFRIDPMSKEMLQNTTLDFKDSIEGSGFVFDNPNVQAGGGGCGGCSSAGGGCGSGGGGCC